MRKYIKLMIVMVVVLGLYTNVVSAAVLNMERVNKVDMTVVDNITNITNSDYFAVWKTGDILFDSLIYDENLSPMLNLYSINNSYGKIGYVLTTLDDRVVVEYALGESPYDEILSDQFNDPTNGKLLLAKRDNDYMYFDASLKLHDIYGSDFQNLNSQEAVKQTIRDKSLMLDSVSTLATTSNPYISYTILSGVGDASNPSSTPGCGPVSGYNLLKYWDVNGYQNLLNASDTLQSVYNELYYMMACIPWTGGQVATLPTEYGSGIHWYFMEEGYQSGINCSTDAFLSVSDFSKVKSEINADRPGIILYNSSSSYGLHYVNLVGYGTDSAGTDYYIIHDLRSNTATDIFKNWEYDVSTNDTVWTYFMINPN